MYPTSLSRIKIILLNVKVVARVELQISVHDIPESMINMHLSINRACSNLVYSQVKV